MTSREIVTMVGRIMIARMTPALNRPTPYVGPPRNGIQPKTDTIQASTVSRRNGARTKTPHSPMTTLGMAASNSITKVSGVASRRGASSDR